MDNCKVSIIVPIYKVEKYLNRCITSIVNQTYGNLEIILVDDGSPDNCPQMCDDWAKRDSRIRVIHKKNGGLSDARNAGIQVITGDYVWFVDSDDYVDQNALDMLIKSAIENKSDVILFDAFRDIDGNITRLRYSFEDIYSTNAEIKKKILGRYYTNNHNGVYCVWNKLYKTSLIVDNGLLFDPDDIRCEDCWFNFKVFHLANKVSFVDNAYYYYFDNDESITHNIKNVNYQIWVRNKKRLLDDNYSSEIDIDFDSFYYEFLMNVIVYLKNLQKLGNKELFDEIVKDEFLKNAIKHNAYLPIHIRLISTLIAKDKIALVRLIFKVWNLK